MKNRGQRGAYGRGFTLIEILVAMTILATVMSILYSAFSASSANAKIVEEKADGLSSLAGALDTFSHEIRGGYFPSEGFSEGFAGKKEAVAFTAVTPFIKEGEPRVQRVSYLFENDKLVRKTMRPGRETEVKGEFMLLEGIKEPSFSFFDGKDWVDEWPREKRLPAGVRIVFTYKGRAVEDIIPVWSAKK